MNAVDRVVTTLDDGRAAVLRTAARTPWLSFVRSRDRRIAVQSTLSVLVAFALTLAAPGVLFVLGPIVLGVPHVVSDARYLVLRRDRSRAWLALVLAGCAAIAALRIVETRAHASFPAIELSLAAAWIAFAAVLGGVRAGRAFRATCILIATVTLLRLALGAPHLARSAFAYLHNIVALVVWVVLFRRSRRYALPALILTAACALLLFSGALFATARLDSAWAQRMVDEAFLAVPLTTSPRIALGVGLSFVFLQAVHYAVWLTWIPQEDLRAEGTTTFAMSLRGLRGDLGLPLLGLTAVAMLTVGIAAVFAVHAARVSYLSIATFHGYLELAALAYLTTRPAPT